MLIQAPGLMVTPDGPVYTNPKYLGSMRMMVTSSLKT